MCQAVFDNHVYITYHNYDIKTQKIYSFKHLAGQDWLPVAFGMVSLPIINPKWQTVN